MKKSKIKSITKTVNDQYKIYKDTIEKIVNNSELTDEAKNKKMAEAQDLWQSVKDEGRKRMLEVFDSIEPRKAKVKDQQLYANTIEEFKHSELLTDAEILDRIKPFTTDSIAIKVLSETVKRDTQKALILQHNLADNEAKQLEKVKNSLVNSFDQTDNEFIESIKFSADNFGVDLSNFDGGMHMIDDLNMNDTDWSNYE